MRKSSSIGFWRRTAIIRRDRWFSITTSAARYISAMIMPSWWPTGRSFCAAWEIWDLTPARLSDYRTNPAEEFTRVYNTVMFTAQLDRYGELGREGCQQLLDDYALSWEAYNALLNQRGGVD
jgi:hypothetical protein